MINSHDPFITIIQIQHSIMSRFPITLQDLDKDTWIKKINATQMSSFQAEAETLPYLEEFVELFDRVHKLPLEDTLQGDRVVMYFFNECFPVVCQKLISSKYFRDELVLHHSNRILELAVDIYHKYLHVTPTFPKFSQLLTVVFEPDVQYFKHNNQLDYKPYPWLYYGTTQDNSFLKDLVVGDLIDVIKYESGFKKAAWSRGTLSEITDDYVTVKYLNDLKSLQKDFAKNSVQIASLNTMSKDFEWRMQLKEGDTLDCCDNYGGWYSGTVVKTRKKQNGMYVKVTFKIFDPAGDRRQKGQAYFGLTDTYDSDEIDVTSPEIQTLGTVAKFREYSFSKSHSDFINDQNDHVIQKVKGERICAIPRNKFCSGTLFKISRKYIGQGGFDRMLELLEQKTNPDLLANFLCPIGEISPMLSRTYVKELVERMKPIVERNFIDEGDATVKGITKEKSEIIFLAMKNLLKRVQSTEQAKEYEVQIKLKLADLCLKTESLKRRLQGLSEVKDILKSVRMHLPHWLAPVGKWLKDNQIFQKIYVQNSHAQLIKKSGEYFKFLITQNLLDVQQLRLIYKDAQRGDFQTRLSVYKLFEEVSHSFKKPHVDYLIDQILDSEINLVATEDLDLLHQLSRYSTYFPLQKVMTFLERILFAENPNSQLLDVAVKRYSQIVVKNNEMTAYRKQTIKMLVDKLLQDKIEVSCRVLTTIVENVGSGQFGRSQILQRLNQLKIDSVVLQAIQKNKDSPKYLMILERLLNLLANAVHNSQRIKLNMDTFAKLWEQLVKNSKNPKQKEIYYKWCSTVVKTQNVFQDGGESKLEDFFVKLTSKMELQSLEQTSFHAISIMFININLKSGNLTQPTVWKNGKEEKTIRLLVPLNQLKFYDSLFSLIYEVQSPKVADLSIQFYSNLYSSQQISVQDRKGYTDKIVKDFFEFTESKQLHKIPRTLKILNLIIDQSQKGGPAPLKPLAVFKKGEKLIFDIVNQNAYMGDNNKSFQVKIDSNSTLFELRKSIAKTLALSWQEIKLNQKDEILDLYNSRLIKDTPLKTSESIKVCKKYNSQLQEQLTVNGKLNPKAAKVLEGVFRRYSTNGIMSREQCYPFTKVCLGDASEKIYEQRIQGLFSKYDDDKDDFLTLANFMNFYEDAARDRPSTVWGNLKNFRFRYDFRSMDDPESDFLDVQALPRYQLSFNVAFYQALFSLLREEDSIAKSSWNLLERMPVSRGLYEELMSSTNYQILNLESPYKTLYCLYIFEYLLENQHQDRQEIQWKDKFTNEQGYQKLFKLYTKLLENDHKMQQVEIEISQFILSLTSEFIVTVFKTQNSIKSHQILKSNLGFDDLIVYVASGQLPKDKSKSARFASIINAQSQVFKFKDHEWKGNTNQEMTEYMIQSIKKLWRMTENSKIRDQMLEDSLSILSILILEQSNCDQFLKVVPELISTAPSHALLIKLYLMLACICFYGKIDQQPVINTFLNFLKISEQSKKHLTIERSGSKNQLAKSTLISEEYFRMLIVLIQAFGLSNMSQQTKDILLNNVLNSRDEQIIQASALVLSRLQLEGIQKDTFSNIWTKCLFSDSISCKKSETREAVYKLVLSIGSYNQAYTSQLTSMVQDTLDESVGKLKTMTQSELKSRSIFNYAGLKNLGAVCYMLAMLQQLYMNPTFRHLLLRVDDHKLPNMSIHNGREYDDNLLHQIQKLFAHLEGTDRGDYNPIDFCYSCKGYDNQPVNICVQQDTQEFIFKILDQLQTALNVTPFKHIISDMYRGVAVNLFTCSKCNQTKCKQQFFFSLSLEVKNSKALIESFDKFTNGQVINQYRCDFCKEEADASTKILIKKLPRVLIVHLKRIVFNLDSMMNEKISSKLQFPFELDMSSYLYNQPVPQTENTNNLNTQSTQQTTKTSTFTEPITSSVQGQSQTTEKVKETNNMYDLVGVVVHNGGAQYGHYYSFIKTQNQQWLEFNDSVVKMFQVRNLQQECFGGSADAIDDEFDWTTKRQNSKNAYLLIYQKREHTPIHLVYRDQLQKQSLLQQLRLRQEPTQITSQDLVKLQEEEPTFSSRKMSKEITKDEEKKQIPEQTLNIQEPVEPYMFEHYSQKITADNLLHQFQVNVWSSAFIRFYTQFLQLNIPQQRMNGITQLTLKMVMGIWYKQPALKQLLSSLEKAINKYPNAGQIIISNEAVVNVLLESSDSDLRSCMESLLLTTIGGLIETNKLQLNKQNALDSKIVKFLDHLFSLIPTTVSKNWMKFNQYFGFWKGFSVQGKVQGQYMMDKQMISHFLDFFLDKKSPLGIYANKKFQLGNKSSNIFPNFTSLLDTVSNLVQVAMLQTPTRLTEDDNRILMNFDFLDKMFSENNLFGGNLVRVMCRRNLVASEKVAIVLIKGFFKANYETIQPLLEVAQSYITIKDQFQQYRIKWVLGCPRLLISSIDNSICCYNTHSFQDRLYSFETTIQIDQAQSILEGLYKNTNRMANYCMLTLKSLLLMCLQNQSIKDYVWNLPSPVVSSAHYYDFFQQFIESYVKDGIKMNSSTFPKVELGQSVMQLYRKIISGDEYIGQTAEKHAEKPALEEEHDKQQIQSCDSVKGMDNNSDTKEEMSHQEIWMVGNKQESGNEEVSDPFTSQTAQQYATNDITFIDPQGYRRHQVNTDQVHFDRININDQVQQPDPTETNRERQKDVDILEIDPLQTPLPIPSNPIPFEDTETKDQGNTVLKVGDTQNQVNQLLPQAEEQDGVYTPVKFKYHETSVETFKGLQIHYHNSELVYLKTQPSLKKNDSFLNTNKKLLDRITPEAWKTAISKPYNGILLVNNSKESYRYKWKFGTGVLKAGESAFVDAFQIIDVWRFDKDEWPRWTLST